MISSVSDKDLVKFTRYGFLFRALEGLNHWTVKAFPRRFLQSSPPADAVKKVLICRIDHLGDVLMTLAVIPMIKKHFKNAQIHILIGEWSKELLAQSPLIDKAIILNHFWLNRGTSKSKSIMPFFIQYFRTAEIIRKEDYDISINFRPYLANAHSLMWLAGVKYKIGYAHFGFSFFLNKVVHFSFEKNYIENMMDLLRGLGIQKDIHADIKISLDECLGKGIITTRSLLENERYVVLCPGTGKPISRWDTQKWSTLADMIKKDLNISRIVLTGGSQDVTINQEIVKRSPSALLDLTGKLSFVELIRLKRRAQFIIALESFPAHLAAALGVPLVVIHNGVTSPSLWKWYSGNQVSTITAPVWCAPCWRSRGCRTMDCLNNISVDDVMRTINKIPRR